MTTLGMWDSWQAQVQAALPAFAASPWYVEQLSPSEAEVDIIVGELDAPVDLRGMTRDEAHGARIFRTRLGPVTRMWVDGNVEIAFLRQALPMLSACDVLDIGAGYGRLAVMLAPLVRSVTCVDPVPISVELCEAYTRAYAPTVTVLDVSTLQRLAHAHAIHPTLAINVHSWNECTTAQITGWLDLLDVMAVPWLFTVSHGQNPGAYPDGRTLSGHPVETSYRAWGADETTTYKPLIEARYTLVAEASIGIARHPHALWARKAAA